MTFIQPMAACLTAAGKGKPLMVFISKAIPMARKRKIPADHTAFAGLPVQMVTLDKGAATVAVHVSGTLSSDTVPLICLAGYHRNMSDFTQFRTLYHHGAGTKQPLVLLDLRGRGRSSDRADKKEYGSPRDARDVGDVANALGIERAVFLGQGYGGQVSMLLGSQRPGLVAGMVLVDIGPVTDSRGLVRLRQNVQHIESLRGTGAVSQGFRRMLQGDYPGANDTHVQILMGRSHYLDKRGRARPLYDPRLITALEAFHHDDVLVAQWQYFDALARVPLMLMRTQLTDQVRRDTFDQMTKRRPDARVFSIQGQGSPALFDQLDEVQAVAQFVAEIERS
ncbi:alpha/beta hydrolase [Devosia algicola]|uniref:Alpha/beta hydrolase n=1 Tax=Devosia algicola TaxID=3026418 RepID=A0ABY7YPI6_9HYPH|nr:alpha/beta hydrolase [Devosia algicola]WDR02980.1 alpha/beta hydrolase [Devosia algicola]